MDRDELGRQMHMAFCAVAGDATEWDDLSESEKEDGRKIAERFLSAAASDTSPRPRAFYARVSLMGKRSLGLCRVTEAPLAGVTMFRCEKDGGVEWVNPAAVYSVTEVPDATAEAEIASALRHAQEVQSEKEGRAAALREARKWATVDVVVAPSGCMVGAIAGSPGLLRLNDSAVSAAIAANGLNGYSFSTLYADEKYETPIGFSAYVSEDITDRMVAAMRSLGFSGANVREAVGDELISAIPF